ncbi:MAG: insulinase family protein [Candidatus Cardinium sp.]|uniref:M16 family metallopeptidase n=1 Tax=Cardinium endosymbiont of Dermatophagoides farinae TaxID=2597823 RepID=UPI001184355B|nr:pitrilysin family protein [Cardinium endosymbiont of Dermatophagoides farinae]TSJ81072.1 insulinase family protein [Cardinium endosymbiont of Dermatophagoides farinae]UWW97107.1 MAG: insulinase family protein [Candidatus Cardinium sp.]
MIHFEKFTLSNGLQVIVHEDPTSHIAVMNVMYDVGARDEHPLQTGFAHLFEHLMFGGSCNIPAYDTPLQQVGGSNNAYTTTDLANYYCSLPAVNLETAFWLESDRMLGLAFNEKSLEVQRKVVIEEFKEHYLNQPYGDAWHHLTNMAYTTHPYRWPTIGQSVSHIESATMDDVKAFFYKFYRPNHAILVVAGKVTQPQVAALCKKWFEPIPAGLPYHRALPQEPAQVLPRRKVVHGDVPFPMLYKAYHMPGRGMPGYYAAEVLCNLLSEGKSALLYANLVEKQALYTRIDGYTTESFDPGLLVISGSLAEKTPFEAAENGLVAVLDQVKAITPIALEKVKNQMETQLVFGQVNLVHRAQELAVATLEGDTNLVNKKIEYIRQVDLEAVQTVAEMILQEQNCSTLHYQIIS